MKKTLSFFIAFLIFAALVVPVSAVDNAEGVDIEISSVTDDLSTIYDVSEFVENSSDSGIYLITVMEYGYGTSDRTLYLYFYNPSRKVLSNTSFNKAELACSFDSSGKPIAWKKQPISIVSTSKDNLLVKCKLGETSGKYYLDINGSRYYSISGVELHSIGDDFDGVTDYEVGYTYAFSGSGDSLTCNRTDQLTISLDVHQTSYLTGDSAKVKDDLDNGWYSNQINSVYFSIPKAVEYEYGDLYSVKYEYYKYRTSPMLVVDNTTTYNKLIADVGQKLGDGNFGYAIRDLLYTIQGEGMAVGYSFGDKQLLTDVSTVDFIYDRFPKVGTYQEYFSTVFKTDDLTDRNTVLVSANKIQDYFKKYVPLNENNEIINHSGKVVGSQGYIGDLFDLDYYDENHFTDEISVKDEVDINSFADLCELQGLNGWKRFWKYGLDIALNIENYDNSIQDLKYIEQVKYSDIPSTPENASNKFLVSVDDITAFRDYCYDAARNSENVYLLRYAISDDYYCLPMYGYDLDCDPLMIQENVYLDFDIITLSFEKNGDITVIPVVSDPTDGFTGIENVTPLPPDEALDEFVDNTFDGLKNWWKDSAPKLLGLGILIVSIVLIAWLCIKIPSLIYGKSDTSGSLFSDKKDKDKENNTTVNITIQEDELRRRSKHSYGRYKGSYRYGGRSSYDRYRYRRRK